MIKYKSISFIGTNLYNFVKYEDKYFEQLKRWRVLNPILADAVEQCPMVYSEQSDHQCYMICRGEIECVGIIYIGTSCDETDLEIKIQIDEEKIREEVGYQSDDKMVEDNIYYIIHSAISSLKVYFYDKANIEIMLLNQLDLHKMNPIEYERTLYFENRNTFKCQNPYHYVIPKIITEMEELKNNLSTPVEVEVFCIDKCHTLIDKDLLDSYENHCVPVREMFHKAIQIEWNFFPSDDSVIETIFRRDGAINFHKKVRNQVNYDIFYHIHSSKFRLSADLRQNQITKKLLIKDNQIFTSLEIEHVLFQTFKETGRKKITYTSPCIGNTSMRIDLVIDSNHQIETCNIDFRTYRNCKTRKNQKVK